MPKENLQLSGEFWRSMRKYRLYLNKLLKPPNKQRNTINFLKSFI